MRVNYKIILQYDGTRYDGWQKQGNTSNTIQGKIEAVLERLDGKPVEIYGSGRTDAGVHSTGQTANFYLSQELPPEEVKRYLNQYLPEDIAVMSAEIVSDRFHSRLHAARKTYSYCIETAEKKPVFERKYVYGLGKPLDVERMKKGALYLIGSHDFAGFCSGKSKGKSTVRRIDEIRIDRKGTKVCIQVTGSGFLYNMVRIIAGTLMEIGLSVREPEAILKVFESRKRTYAGFTAPAEGLFLERVEYQEI